MKAIFPQIKNHIDNSGSLVANEDEVKASISAAEQLGKSLEPWFKFDWIINDCPNIVLKAFGS